MERESLLIPAAIVIAAGLIAGAIYFNDSDSAPAKVATEGTETSGGIRPVDESDHIRGNPNAPILLVEYSDYDCPFCKQFHDTMTRVMSEYGLDGKVAWVYRHFPLVQLHPNAPRLAEAAECVAEAGGNDAFWAFSDLIFFERNTNELTDISRLPEFAETAGVDRGTFELCYNSRKYQDEVEASYEEALAAGARGTPFTVVIVGNQHDVIDGAQPYNLVRQMIETLLAQVEGRS